MKGFGAGLTFSLRAIAHEIRPVTLLVELNTGTPEKLFRVVRAFPQ